MKPTPMELHRQAEEEFPDDQPARVQRYGELMVEHGYIVDDATAMANNFHIFACGRQGGKATTIIQAVK